MRLPLHPGLLTSAGAAGFTAAWAMLGQVSHGYRMWDVVVEPYSPVAQPISGLGLGATGPWMNSAFVACGALVAVGAWASSRRWPREGGRRHRVTPALLAATGIGMATCGIFDLEQIMPHTLGFLVAVAAPATGLVLLGTRLWRSRRSTAAALVAAGVSSAAGLVAFMATFDPVASGEGVGSAGLLQRVLVTLVLASVSAAALLDPPGSATTGTDSSTT